METHVTFAAWIACPTTRCL